MRPFVKEIRDLGAELAVVGNGKPAFARAFRQELDFPGPVLSDPALGAYRAAGFSRRVWGLAAPRVLLHGLRAFRGGSRQRATQGDPLQLGGVLVIRPDGRVSYRYVSREAGDHAPAAEILEGVRRAVAA